MNVLPRFLQKPPTHGVARESVPACHRVSRQPSLTSLRLPVLHFSWVFTRGNVERIKIEQQTFMGSVWIIGWLFTIGFLHLGFWKGVLAIVLWAYYLGDHFSSLAH